MANTVVYNKHDYIAKLRQRLNRPVNWKEALEVNFTDSRTYVMGGMTTEFTSSALTRGTAYSFSDFALTAYTLTLSTDRVVPAFIDRADLYQQRYTDQMEMADRQAKVLSEFIETDWLDDHASWTDFGVGDLNSVGPANDTATITVSATNIDDIIRGVKRKINANNGAELAQDKGIMYVWRPGDFEILEAYVQAQGFSEADMALKNGITAGLYYFRGEHYFTNDNAANHLFAGVKKLGVIALNRSLWGQVVIVEEPAGSSNNNLSGIGVVSRATYGLSWPGLHQTLWQDINVS